MCRIMIVTAALVVCAVAGAWTPAGSNGASGAGLKADSNYYIPADYVHLVLNAAREPVLFYPVVHDASPQFGMRSHVLRSGTWQATTPGSDVGAGILGSGNYLITSTQAIADGPGRPMIFFCDAFGVRKLRGLRLEGSTWVGMGGSDTGAPFDPLHSYYDSMSVSLTSAGEPIVAYWTNTDKLFVKQYNGSAWVEAGSGSATGNGLFPNAQSKIGFLGGASGLQPVISWHNGTAQLSQRFTGSAWVGLDGVSTSTVMYFGSTGGGAIKGCAAANGVLAATRGMFGTTSRYSGTAWSFALSHGTREYPSIALTPASEILIAGRSSTTSTIEVKKHLGGSNWMKFGFSTSAPDEIGFMFNPVSGPGVPDPHPISISIDEVGGIVYVAWVNHNRNIYVKQASLVTAASNWHEYQ